MSDSCQELQAQPIFQREEQLEVAIVTWNALRQMERASDPLVRMWVVVKGLALYDCLVAAGSWWKADGHKWAVGLRDRVAHDAYIPTPEETALAIEVLCESFRNDQRQSKNPGPAIPDALRSYTNESPILLDWPELERLACLQNQPVRTMAVLLAYQKLETEERHDCVAHQAKELRNDAAHNIDDPSPEEAQIAVQAFFRASRKTS